MEGTRALRQSRVAPHHLAVSDGEIGQRDRGPAPIYCIPDCLPKKLREITDQPSRATVTSKCHFLGVERHNVEMRANGLLKCGQNPDKLFSMIVNLPIEARHYYR